MYILLCFLLLVTGFYPVWFGHCGFLETRSLPAEVGRGASAACTAYGALREDCGAGLKMAHVLCRHVVPGVGSVGSPEFLCCVQTERPPSRDRCEDGRTCARTSQSFLFLLLAVERMLEPLLLPCEKTIATKT
jgi:hypothetical protein